MVVLFLFIEFNELYVVVLVDGFVFVVVCKGNCVVGVFFFCGDFGYYLNFEGIILFFIYIFLFSDFFKLFD